MCVEMKRCWPREDPERDFGAELRFSETGPWAHQLTCGFRIQTAYTAWRLEHTPRTVMIAVEMTVTLCSHCKMDHCGNILCSGRDTPGPWAPARGSELRGKYAPPELFSPTQWFSAPHCFQGEPLAAAAVQPPNFWHGGRGPAWDRLSTFPCFPCGAGIHGWVHLLKPEKEKSLCWCSRDNLVCGRGWPWPSGQSLSWHCHQKGQK